MRRVGGGVAVERPASGTGSGAGSVSVLDSQTGRLVRTLSVGHGPVALVVDARANRVVVACRGVSGSTPPWFRRRPVGLRWGR